MSTSGFTPPPFLNELADRLAALARASPAAELEHNLKAGVTAMLGKLDLVTREEFDVQAELLRRAQVQLGELEMRLAELEMARSSDAVVSPPQ